MNEPPLYKPAVPAEPPPGLGEGVMNVFAYGSLIWNPGFPFLAARPARLRGWRRAFCVWSHHYRGTVDDPGLVLGLAPGGETQGVLYAVAAQERTEVLAYLRARELVTNVYLEEVVAVEVADGRLPALTYVADPDHEQYAGELSFLEQVELIAHAEGVAGRNRDYLAATVAALNELGIVDPDLDRLAAAVAAVPAAALGEHMR